MLNHIVCMGRLVREPELRYTKDKVPVGSCRIAVNRPGSDKADFFDVVAWRHSGEFLTKHFVIKYFSTPLTLKRMSSLN